MSYQLKFETHPKTCKLCEEKYHAKGFCLKHYIQDYKKKWNERNPDYQKNYAKSYYQKIKNNPKFRKKRNAYMKNYMRQRYYMRDKLAKLTIPINLQSNTIPLR